MRVLVYGGRDYRDKKRVFAELDALHADTPISVIIQGDAPGADRYGKWWARARGVPTEDYPADWDDLQAKVVRARKRPDGTFYNAAAGNTRNLRMMAQGKPDAALEFPGGNGTSSMRRIVLAEMRRRPLHYVRIEKE